MKRTSMTLLFSVALFGLSSAVFLTSCKKESTGDNKSDPASDPAKVTDQAPAGSTTPNAETKDDKAPTASAGFAAAAGTYKIDPVHTAINFKVKHMNVSHTLGRFNKAKGKLVLAAKPSASSISIEVDAASIYTADKKRDEHLKGPDFFNTAQFPTITFVSKTIAAAKDGHYTVTGDLTLHGVTKSVVADFEHVGSGKSMMDPKQFLSGFTGSLKLKRTDFGMTNMVGPAGDEVDLTIAIEALRQ